MTSKINVTENITIIIEPKQVDVVTTLNFDMSINFDNKDAAPTLDENGDLFEPVYKCKIKAIPKSDVFYTSLTRLKDNIKDLQEIKKFFEFVNENKENLFEMQDNAYKDFNKKLIPNIDENLMIGIRVPELRRFAKNLYRNDPERTNIFLDTLPHHYMEENQK